MKTKNLLKVLSLAVLLGGLAKVSSFSDFKSSGSELFLESTQGTDMFDDCQEGLRLQGPRRAQETGDLLASDVKVQVSNIDRFGNRSIRYVAAISSLAVDASFERTIYNENGSVFAESSVKAVQYAYESIIANGEEVLPSSFGEGYNYFIVYTLGNVPESHWFHRIDVSVKVNEEESSRQANVEGVLPLNEKLDFTLIDGTETYEVKANSTDIVVADIPAYYKTYNDVVATRGGEVVRLASYAFEGCTQLKELHIPKTISKVNNYSFKSVGSITLDRVYYNSKHDLKTYGTTSWLGSSTALPAINELYIGPEVVSIPKNAFKNTVNQVYYAGTEANWSAITNNASTYVSIPYCKDTVDKTFTFHFEGGSMEVDGQVYYDKYSFVTYNGKSISNPGEPVKNGYKYGGWFLEESYENKVTEFGVVSDATALNYYAEFEKDVTGMYPNNPIKLSLGLNEPVTTTWAMSHAYFTFTPEENDYYYFEDVSTDEFKSKVWLYDSNMNSLTSVESSTTSKFLLQYELEAGKEYFLRAGSYAEITNTQGWERGTVQFNIYRKDGDSINEAAAIKYNVEETITYSGIPNYLEYEPENDEQACVRLNFTKVSCGYPEISVLKKSDKSEVYSTTFNTRTSLVADYCLDKNETYIFVIKPASKGEYKIKLSHSPEGASYLNPLPYNVGDEVVIDYATNGNYLKDNDSGLVYYDTYFKFTAQSSFNGTLKVYNPETTSAKDPGVVLTVYENGEVFYTAGSMDSRVKDPEVELTFTSGKEYIINVVSPRNSASSTTTFTATTFSIISNSVVETPDEEETIEPTGGDSLENPFVLDEKLGLSSPIDITLAAGERKYYKITVKDFFTDLEVSSGFEVKLYALNTFRLQDDSSSSANIVMSYNGYDPETYIVELYSENGGTTSLSIQDNYYVYNPEY